MPCYGRELSRFFLNKGRLELLLCVQDVAREDGCADVAACLVVDGGFEERAGVWWCGGCCQPLLLLLRISSAAPTSQSHTFGGQAPLRLAAQKSRLHAPTAPMRSTPAYFL